MTTENTNLPVVDVAYKLTPATIDIDMVTLKASLVSKIEEQSKTVVTVDNLKESKALASEMNKIAKAISTARKAAMDEAMTPLKAFESGMKELEKIATDGRAVIASQVETFERETLEQIKNQLGEALGYEWDKLSVPAKFRKSGINDLVLLGSITAKGALTGAVKKTLEGRAMSDRMQADLIEKRLLSLENESYKAGLAAPLTEHHVAVFLYDDEESYQSKLSAILNAEKEREIQAARRREIEHEHQQRMQQEAIERQQRQHEEQMKRQQEQLERAEDARKEAEQRAAAASASVVAPVQQQATQSIVAPSAHAKCAVLTPAGQVPGIKPLEAAQTEAIAISAANPDGFAMIYSKDFNNGKSAIGVAVRGAMFWSAESGM